MPGSRPNQNRKRSSKRSKKTRPGQSEPSRGSGPQKGAKAKSDRPRQKKGPRTAFQHLQNLSKWVDLIIEVLDARVPVSTRHPNADSIFGNRPRIFVLTKEDLSDSESTRVMMNNLSAKTGIDSILVSLKRGSGKDKIINMVLEATREKQESLKRKGILPRPMRICVVGLPNVGKSSLINWLIGRKKTKTGNRPGITQGTQWVRVHPQLELLDTPGILPATEFSGSIKQKLAAMNLIPQNNYKIEPVAEDTLKLLLEKYPDLVESYMSGIEEAEDGFTFMAQKRNLLGPKAVPDRLRACSIFLAELRDGKLGRITLD